MLNNLGNFLPNLIVGLIASLVGMGIALFFVRKEIRILIHL